MYERREFTAACMHLDFHVVFVALGQSAGPGRRDERDTVKSNQLTAPAKIRLIERTFACHLPPVG